MLQQKDAFPSASLWTLSGCSCIDSEVSQYTRKGVYERDRATICAKKERSQEGKGRREKIRHLLFTTTTASCKLGGPLWGLGMLYPCLEQ